MRSNEYVFEIRNPMTMNCVTHTIAYIYTMAIHDTCSSAIWVMKFDTICFACAAIAKQTSDKSFVPAMDSNIVIATHFHYSICQGYGNRFVTHASYCAHNQCNIVAIGLSIPVTPHQKAYGTPDDRLSSLGLWVKQL